MENRRLLAGDVAVSIQADGVLVQGDHRSNQIEITEGRPNQLTITGLEGTTVNGRSSITINLPRRDALTVLLGRGNDELLLHDASLADVSIKGHGGADRIFVERVVSKDDIDIRGGRGNDSIVVDSVIADEIILKGNKDDDFIAVFANDFATRCNELDIRGGRGGLDRHRIIGEILASYIYIDTE